MREIKFRAWDNKEKQFVGEWDTSNNSPVEFDCNGVARVSYKELTCYCNPENACGGCADKYNEAEDVTVEQFTGLHDKNGKEIYEGDIINVETGEYHVMCRYNESDGCFEYIDPWDELFDTLGGYDGCYSVIGNIHENTELMGKS